MEAIMYAAGVGRRLNQRFGEIPKILIELGGRTVLERHVEHLASNGLERLTLVTGYERERIAPLIKSLPERYPVTLAERVNPDYEEGSVLSFLASVPLLQTLKEPVLLMDGDVLYPSAMLHRLLHSEHRTALLVDRNYSTEDDDPVLVPIREGRPVDFVKGWAGEAESVGESVGFFKVAPEDLPTLIEGTRRRLEGPGRGDSYDAVLREMVQAGRFGCEDVTGMPWTELDSPEDVERARKEVLPAVEAFDRMPR